ncbi:MAG: hypothetical protein LK562_03755 [Candidatus Accumulibacter phosphatis]|nr:hypothetical protein [Candidatus Accumulibacter phosphatis]
MSAKNARPVLAFHPQGGAGAALAQFQGAVGGAGFGEDFQGAGLRGHGPGLHDGFLNCGSDFD